MGAGRQAAPPHPFQTALTPPGLETPGYIRHHTEDNSAVVKANLKLTAVFVALPTEIHLQTATRSRRASADIDRFTANTPPLTGLQTASAGELRSRSSVSGTVYVVRNETSIVADM